MLGDGREAVANHHPLSRSGSRLVLTCRTNDSIESLGAAVRVSATAGDAVENTGNSGSAIGMNPSAPGVDPDAQGNAKITLHEG